MGARDEASARVCACRLLPERAPPRIRRFMPDSGSIVRPVRTMPSVKKTLSKRRLAAAKARITVDPTRLALSAVERLKALLVRTGQVHKLGLHATMRELVTRGNALGHTLPPSYSAAM